MGTPSSLKSPDGRESRQARNRVRDDRDKQVFSEYTHSTERQRIDKSSVSGGSVR